MSETVLNRLVSCALDMYRSFLDVIDAQISELADCIDKIQGADYV